MIVTNIPKRGAYLLFLRMHQSAAIEVGRLGKFRFTAGLYIYVGSASRGIQQRIDRHRRLAETKAGKIHWHVDFLLTHPKVRLIGSHELEGSDECAVSHRLASTKGITTPLPGFGSTDCRAGCKAHFYQFQGDNLNRFAKFVSKKAQTTARSFANS